jgi:hypothetical protein
MATASAPLYEFRKTSLRSDLTLARKLAKTMMKCAKADVATLTTAATVSVLGAAAAPITGGISLVFIGAAVYPGGNAFQNVVTKYKLARNRLQAERLLRHIKSCIAEAQADFNLGRLTSNDFQGHILYLERAAKIAALLSEGMSEDQIAI